MNNAKTALNKEKATLEGATQQADKRVKKLEQDIANLEDATCYTCGQALHEDKKQEIFETKSKELSESTTYQTEVTSKLNEIVMGLQTIGELDQKPQLIMKQCVKHMNIETMLTV